jgi:hypothetical protein
LLKRHAFLSISSSPESILKPSTDAKSIRRQNAFLWQVAQRHSMNLVMNVIYLLYQAGKPLLAQDMLKDINGNAIGGIDRKRTPRPRATSRKSKRVPIHNGHSAPK